ncbi:MAG: hypothetical protein SFZ02_02595 [bacterium]|nr:hypothetical protein [bacterium]
MKTKSESRFGFDNWVMGMEKIYQLPSETPIKLLTDALMLDNIPLTYFFQKSQMLLKKYPNHPKMRIVVLLPESQGLMGKAVLSFAQILRTGDDIRILYGDNHKQALDWLFANEPHQRPSSLSNKK